MDGLAGLSEFRQDKSVQARIAINPKQKEASHSQKKDQQHMLGSVVTFALLYCIETKQRKLTEIIPYVGMIDLGFVNDCLEQDILVAADWLESLLNADKAREQAELLKMLVDASTTMVEKIEAGELKLLHAAELNRVCNLIRLQVIDELIRRQPQNTHPVPNVEVQSHEHNSITTFYSHLLCHHKLYLAISSYIRKRFLERRFDSGSDIPSTSGVQNADYMSAFLPCSSKGLDIPSTSGAPNVDYMNTLLPCSSNGSDIPSTSGTQNGDSMNTMLLSSSKPGVSSAYPFSESSTSSGEISDDD
ncbi:hypothetical protein DICVIV_13410 [Dictyocaulus viviparus]|uniref:Uncharacterized protein n=1 Tax=Dictyocaulus viviparus TaxID=29172 RepID=A0A0D8XDW9_DICVI|nr:hypothetical protein DICVIV_13410 [Dictyocaulus viviparus]